MNDPKHLRQCWIALLLTTGEFVVAIILLVHDGHLLALYLAITYASRETEGGRKYHELLMHMVKHAFGKEK